MMSLGGELQLGLFIVLAGGFASVLRRYTDWSAPGTVAVGVLGAAFVAIVLFDPAEDAVQEVLASEASRDAFVTALGAQQEDILVQSRGPGSVTVWFTVPEELSGECGEYPDQKVRAHLATLGFLRIVVQDRSQAGGLCSFRP